VLSPKQNGASSHDLCILLIPQALAHPPNPGWLRHYIPLLNRSDCRCISCRLLCMIQDEDLTDQARDADDDDDDDDDADDDDDDDDDDGVTSSRCCCCCNALCL